MLRDIIGDDSDEYESGGINIFNATQKSTSITDSQKNDSDEEAFILSVIENNKSGRFSSNRNYTQNNENNQETERFIKKSPRKLNFNKSTENIKRRKNIPDSKNNPEMEIEKKIDTGYRSEKSSRTGDEYELIPKANNLNHSFIDEQQKIKYKSAVFDPSYPLKSYNDWIFRETKEIYAYGGLFYIECIEMIMMFACCIISLLSVNLIIDMSSKIYLIVGSILFGVILIFVHLPVFIVYWAKNNMLNHVHMSSVSLSLIVNIICNAFIWTSFGFWSRDYVDEFELDSDVFDTSHPEIFSRFAFSHAILISLFIITLSLYPNSLWAHMHPEMVVNRKNSSVLGSLVKKKKNKE